MFENWEADIGKTVVLGSDPQMLKLKQDVESAWHEGKAFYDANRLHLTGADFLTHQETLASLLHQNSRLNRLRR